MKQRIFLSLILMGVASATLMGMTPSSAAEFERAARQFAADRSNESARATAYAIYGRMQDPRYRTYLNKANQILSQLGISSGTLSTPVTRRPVTPPPGPLPGPGPRPGPAAGGLSADETKELTAIEGKLSTIEKYQNSIALDEFETSLNSIQRDINNLDTQLMARNEVLAITTLKTSKDRLRNLRKKLKERQAAAGEESEEEEEEEEEEATPPAPPAGETEAQNNAKLVAKIRADFVAGNINTPSKRTAAEHELQKLQSVPGAIQLINALADYNSLLESLEEFRGALAAAKTDAQIKAVALSQAHIDTRAKLGAVPEGFSQEDWNAITKNAQTAFKKDSDAYAAKLRAIEDKEKAEAARKAREEEAKKKKEEQTPPPAAKFATMDDAQKAYKAGTLTKADVPALKALQQKLTAEGKTIEAGNLGSIIEEVEL